MDLKIWTCPQLTPADFGLPKAIASCAQEQEGRTADGRRAPWLCVCALIQRQMLNYFCWHQTYPLVNIQKTIENGHLDLIYPLTMVIFHSYVGVPEGR